MSSRIGHLTRRHPLCPSCGYNLVATVAENRRVCPECGEPFELHELHRTVAPDDWTLLRGLRWATPVLLLRITLLTPAWTAGLLILRLIETAFTHWFGTGAAVFMVVVVPILVGAGGVMTSVVLGRGLNDRLGFDGFGVAVICIAAALLTIGLGVVLAGLCPWPLIAAPVGILILGGFFALVPPIRAVLLDEM